jgi:hypothetical protein
MQVTIPASDDSNSPWAGSDPARVFLSVLLFLKFRDRLDPTLFRNGKADRIAGMQRVQRQAVLCFELFGRTTGVCSDGTALRLSNCDAAIDPVNFGHRSRKRLLGQSR